MSGTLKDVNAQIRLNNLREATYLLYSIARRETEDYEVFDEEAEINFYYSLRRAAKYHPERIRLLHQYLKNVRVLSAILHNIAVYLETGVNKGLTIQQTPYEILYNSARA